MSSSNVGQCAATEPTVRNPIASRIKQQARLLTFRMTVFRRLNTGGEIGDPYVVQWTDDVRTSVPSPHSGMLVGSGVEFEPLAWLEKTFNPFSKTVPNREAPVPYQPPRPPIAFVSFVERTVYAVTKLESELDDLRNKCADFESKLRVLEFAAEANKVPKVETLNTATLVTDLSPDGVERMLMNFVEGGSLDSPFLVKPDSYEHVLSYLRKMPPNSRSLALEVAASISESVARVATKDTPWVCDLNTDRFSVAGLRIGDVVAFLNTCGVYHFELLRRGDDHRDKFVRVSSVATVQLNA